MAASLGSLVVRLGLDAADYVAGMDRSEYQARKMVRQITTEISKIGTAFVAMGATAVGAVGILTKSAIDGADSVAKMAQSAGVGIEALSQLKYAADLSGVSVEQLGIGIGRLNRNISDTAAGTGEAREAFKALGIDVKTADGNLKNADRIMEEVADRFLKMEDGAGKSAIAMMLFGKSGAAMIPLLNGGSAGIKQLREEADALGLTITSKTGKAAEEFNDNLTRLNYVKQGLFNTIAEDLLPSLVSVSNEMVRSAKETGALKDVAKVAADSLRLLATAGIVVGAGFKVAGDSLGKLMAAFSAADINWSRMTSPTGAMYEMARAAAANGAKVKAILSSDSNDIASTIETAANLIDQVWKRAADSIVASAPETGRKIAAPLLTAEKEAKAAAERAKREAKELAEYMKRTQLQMEGQEAVNAAQAELNAYLDAELNKRIAIAAAIRDQLDPTRELVRKQQEAQRLADEGLLTQEEANRIYEEAQQKIYELGVDWGKVHEKTKEGIDVAKELGMTFNSAFEDAIVKGESFRETLRGIAQDILRIATRKLVTEPMGKAVSDAVGGIDFGGIFSGAGTGIASLFGFRAAGGPVTAGSPYIVGERGPELMVPRMSGTVVPNHALGGGGTVFNQSFNVGGSVTHDDLIRTAEAAKQGALAGMREEQRRGRARA